MQIIAPSLADESLSVENESEDFESGPLWELYERRKENNQDLVVLIADHQNRRGTGKTTLTLKLAKRMNVAGELTMDKCALDPVQIRDAYTTEPKKSALVMDEAEAGIGNRDSMTNVNKAVMEIMSMGRVQEKYVLLNAPNSTRIDKGVRELCDILILVEARGRARVYRFVNNPFESSVYYNAIEELHWGPIEDGQVRSVYESLTEEKLSRLEGSENEGLVRESEVQKRIEREASERVQQVRDEIIVQLYRSHEHWTYQDVADWLESVDEEISVSANRVGTICREARSEQ